MTDNTNKGFWERMARIYTAFMSKNDTAYRQICKLSEQYIDVRSLSWNWLAERDRLPF